MAQRLAAMEEAIAAMSPSSPGVVQVPHSGHTATSADDDGFVATLGKVKKMEERDEVVRGLPVPRAWPVAPPSLSQKEQVEQDASGKQTCCKKENIYPECAQNPNLAEPVAVGGSSSDAHFTIDKVVAATSYATKSLPHATDIAAKDGLTTVRADGGRLTNPDSRPFSSS